MRILDIGCGLGRWTKELVKTFPDAEIIASDHKRRMPRIKGVKFVKGSIESLSFNEDEFDLVILSRVLPYVDMIKAIDEVERITKKSGLIVYELMQTGYYLKELLKGHPKRTVNFINWAFYRRLETRLFKQYDNIDSGLSLRYFSRFNVIEKYPLKSFGIIPALSLIFMKYDFKINKSLHNKIKKIAEEVLEIET